MYILHEEHEEGQIPLFSRSCRFFLESPQGALVKVFFVNFVCFVESHFVFDLSA